MMLLVMFVLGGICGYLFAAILCIGSEIKQLRMENEAIKQDRDYWKYQALGARRLQTGAKVTTGGESNEQEIKK